MTSSLIWNNLLTYCLQVGLLVGLSAFVPALLRFRVPAAKLLYLQILLAVCLALPVVEPWKQPQAGNSLEVSTSVVIVQRQAARQAPGLPWREIGLATLAAGVILRLAFLAAGFGRLRRYRRRARSYGMRDGIPTLLSGDIASPVTFGFRQPVVLLPNRFPSLDRGMQEAILCHELLHVTRHDWIVTVAEEVVRAVFWFHPAVWWVLGEIQLSREQAVDREVVARTRAREQYVDTLLHIAGAALHPEMAPAPLFLRRRHLKQRVVSIFKEVPMSKTRSMAMLAVGLVFLVTACWLVTGTLPLAAAPQAVIDGPGVSVDIGSANLLHRTGVSYPDAARSQHIQGAVQLEARLDAAGNVVDARVISGPDELRRASLDSVLQWHFASGAAGAVRQVTIAFQYTDGKTPPTPSSVSAMKGLEGRRLAAVHTSTLSDQVRSDLLAVLPMHEGDTLTADLLDRAEQAVRRFDEHLRMSAMISRQGELVLEIGTADSVARPTEVGNATPQRIKIGGSVMQLKLVRQPHPVYPPEAKAGRIQGVVRLSAVVGKDGSIQKLEVISGHPLLVPAAVEAVQQWRYQSTLLNGDPVEVITQIDVNFTLLP